MSSTVRCGTRGRSYECTPVVVSFLARVVAYPGGHDGTRAQVALLLCCVASATSFVLPQQPLQGFLPGWLREPDAVTPPRDLAQESHADVAASVDVLVRALPGSPPATRAALLAVLAAASPGPGSVMMLAVQEFEDDSDLRLATAARAVRLLADGELTDEALVELSAVDDEAADYLESTTGWPLGVRVMELVRELVERVVSDRLA